MWPFFQGVALLPLPYPLEDGGYLILTVWKGTDARYRLLYRDLEERDAQPVELMSEYCDRNRVVIVASDRTKITLRKRID